MCCVFPDVSTAFESCDLEVSQNPAFLLDCKRNPGSYLDNEHFSAQWDSNPHVKNKQHSVTLQQSLCKELSCDTLLHTCWAHVQFDSITTYCSHAAARHDWLTGGGA